MKTHKLKVRLNKKVRLKDIKEIEIEAINREEAIRLLYLMHRRDLAKLVGKEEATFTGWDLAE